MKATWEIVAELYGAGDWVRFRDIPHYEIETGLSMAQKRAAYKKRGSVL